MHCTLFREDNGKQGRQLCKAAERVSNRMSYKKRRQYLVTDQDVQSTQNKSKRGVEPVPWQG